MKKSNAVMKKFRKNDDAVMENGTASERALALVHEILDVMMRAEMAPDSPLNDLHPAPVRRDYRRLASRLRKGKTEPRYKNLYSAEELAGILERTARRDEIIEEGVRDFKRLNLKLADLFQEDPSEVTETIRALVSVTARAAELEGPGSEAARRLWHFQFLGFLGEQWHSRHRHERSSAPLPVPPLAMDPSVEARFEAIAAEILDSPPAGETVITIPPDGRDFGRGRVCIRIGVGAASWVGNFARGHLEVPGSVLMLPGDRHVFIAAAGAGYIVDLKSRTLVGRAGLEVAGVLRDDARGLFILVHNDLSFESLGTSGRLWRTYPIGIGLRRVTFTPASMTGEAWKPYPAAWVPFSLSFVTGEVRYGEGG